MTDLNKLRELAEAAVPAMTRFYEQNTIKGDALKLHYFSLEATPDAIITLLDRLEAAERDAKRYRWLRSTAGTEKATYGLEIFGCARGPKDVDYDVDAAMEEQSK